MDGGAALTNYLFGTRRHIAYKMCGFGDTVLNCQKKVKVLIVLESIEALIKTH